MRGSGTILGTPNHTGLDLSKTCLLSKREPVPCLFTYVHPNALHSLLCLEAVLDRCHPAVFAEREGCPYVVGGPPMLTAQLSGIHLMPMFPLARPAHDSGQVPPSAFLALRNPLLQPTPVDFYLTP